MKLGVINTGGTISCVGSPLSPMTAERFAIACTSILDPIIEHEFEHVDLDYMTDLAFPESENGALDSTNLQPTDWCLMAEYILRSYAAYDGWIVLHGTDSMDFTASALPFLLSRFDSNAIPTAVLSKPVIITGSQLPMFHEHPDEGKLSLNFNTDAFQNFCGAIASARTGVPEVCVYFENRLYRGNRVMKTNASEFNAFSCPNYPPLAEYGSEYSLHKELILAGPVSYEVSLDNPQVLESVLGQLAAIHERINDCPVMKFSAFPAWYDQLESTSLVASLIRACVDQGIKGLILESYGEGNFPSGNPDTPSSGAIYHALDMANRDGVFIVDCTQVIAGVVDESAYASGAWLPTVGALNPADMSSMAAFTKLTLILASWEFNGWDVESARSLVQTNLCGEMMNVSRLDSRANRKLLAGERIRALDGSAMLRNDQVRGPVLVGIDGAVLWAPANPSGQEIPGRLVMQDDGNLVYYSRFNVPLWASNTGVDSGGSSQLIIAGSYAKGNLLLQVYNYSENAVSAVLYQQSH